MDDRVTLFRALADPTRIAIVERLAKADLTAGEIARALRASPPRTSNHLARLLREGIVEARADGRTRVYSLRHPEVGRFLKRADAAAVIVATGRRR